MKVLVTGASGFTGSFVVPTLIRQGFRVRCFVREKSDLSRLGSSDVELARGDLAEPRSLETALRGIDALVNLASLGFGHAPGIVDAALSARVPRAIFFSTTAVFTSLNAPSKARRLAAEKTIRENGLPSTLLRPTMIYGNAYDRNMSRLVRYLKSYPIIPILGTGDCLQQPVHVQDLADAVVAALQSNRTTDRSYNLPGKMPLSFNQVIDTICRLLNRRVRKMHLPALPVVVGLSWLERLHLRLPIKAEQISRLNEDKAFDYSAATEDFGYSPRSFAEGMHAELLSMGLV